MNEHNLLSVSAFAEQAKVSRQALYKQIQNENSQLAPYIVKQGKQIFIRSIALVEIYNLDNQETTQNQPLETTKSTQNSGNQTTLTTNETTNNQPLTTQIINQLQAQIADLQADKQRLNEQVQEKDQIIKSQGEKIALLAEQLAEVANKAITATQQQQFLTATEKLPLPDGEPEPEPGAKKKTGLRWWQRKR